jgi:hypothetical protein
MSLGGAVLIGLIGLVIGGVAVWWLQPTATAQAAGPSWPRRAWSELIRLWGAIFPDFSAPHTGRDITQTFRLLITAMLIFGVFQVGWAGSAAVMRAAYLYQLRPDGLKEVLPIPNDGIVFPDEHWQTWLFLVLEILRAIGGITLICLASGLVGAFLGFLFGIPRPVSAAEAPPAAASPFRASADAKFGNPAPT